MVFYELHKKIFPNFALAYGGPEKARALSYEFLYLAVIFLILSIAGNRLRLPIILNGIFFIVFALAVSATSLLRVYIQKKSSRMDVGDVCIILRKKKDILWFYYFIQLLFVCGAIIFFVAAVFALKKIIGF